MSCRAEATIATRVADDMIQQVPPNRARPSFGVLLPPQVQSCTVGGTRHPKVGNTRAVSYTHLTLPTILRV